MAETVQIGGTDESRVFLGTDWTWKSKVMDKDTDPTGLTAKDIAGWAIMFDVRRSDASQTALFTKALTITGTFNSTLASSTQYMLLTIADTDLTPAVLDAKGGTYFYSIKRTDDGFETILVKGEIVVERATQV